VSIALTSEMPSPLCRRCETVNNEPVAELSSGLSEYEFHVMETLPQSGGRDRAMNPARHGTITC